LNVIQITGGVTRTPVNRRFPSHEERIREIPTTT
jgi:hypothetical protein